MQPKSQSLKALLGGNAELRQLTATARELQQLHAAVCRLLPAALRGHCLGVEQQADTLILYMDNAANATLIRYQQRQLLSQLASLRLACKQLKARISPPAVPPPVPKRVSRTLPEPVRTMLQSTAAGLEDGPLSRALRNLARRRSPRP
ncbi:MAG TPA: DciA family protein [Gammaproteobacteria bacterium]|nr:DciA family protein [Gammaproteobacteria bacterium]